MEAYEDMMFVLQIGPDGGIALPQQALHLLMSFLGRSRQLEPDLRAELERLGVHIPAGGCRVAMFEVDESPFAYKVPLERQKSRMTTYARLSRDLNDRFYGRVEGFLFLAMGYLVGILFCNGEGVPQQLCGQVMQAWKETGVGKFSATFSRRYPHLAQVAMAYEEVSSRQRGRMFFTSQPTVLDGERMAKDREYLWSSRFAEVDNRFQQLAQRICGEILTGQQETAHEYMDEALDLILDEGAHSTHYVEVQMIGALFSARLSSALKAAGVLQPAYEAEHAMAAALLDCHQDWEFRRAAHDCLDGYWSHYRDRQSERGTRQMAALREFLTENATDPQVGLGMAARRFSAHPATLATSFRKTYGESVGDYINRVRVQKAKDLLQGGGVSVQEASERVGFCSGTTMYRAFLRYEGRPPKSFKGQAAQLPEEQGNDQRGPETEV